MFSSPNQPGGTRHFELAGYCVQRNCEFTIVASDISYATGKIAFPHKGLFAEQHLSGVRVLRTYTYPSLHRSFRWRVVSFVSFMISSVLAALKVGPLDLVIGTSPPLFQAISAWVVSVLRRCPFLLEIRDLWPAFAIDIGVLKNPVLIALSRWLERFLYARATHILVNSPAYRTYLISKGIPAPKITLIANGVDSSEFIPTARGERIRERWGLQGKFVATYAGSLGLANDIPTILRAADRLRSEPRTHFLIIGDGKERLNAEKLSAELRLSNVTFTGAVQKAEIPEYLAASDVCLAILKDIPMFRTTYPNKVFDYMAAGRPTILVIDGVIREVIEAANGGVFVRPGDDRALADAVRLLSQEPDRLLKMGSAARTYVVEHFNRHRQAEQFFDLLNVLCGRERAAPVSVHASAHG